MTALVISGIATVATRLSSATVSIAIQRTRYGIRYGSSRHRSEPVRGRAGGGAIAGAARSVSAFGSVKVIPIIRRGGKSLSGCSQTLTPLRHPRRPLACRTGSRRARRSARRGPAAASWLPRSTMRPSSTTRIVSAARTVDSRWAITIEVRPASASASACCTAASDSESSDAVASSSTTTRDRPSSRRAMVSRWRCPPESR